MSNYLFKSSLSFDDVLLEPKYSEIISRSEIDISTEIGEMRFKLPVVSSPMDTVTETDMLQAMDTAGGLGIAHRYNSIEDQCKMVSDAKSRGATYVGAAVGVSGDFVERAESLADAGVSVLCIDIAHGHHVLMKNAINTIKVLG